MSKWQYRIVTNTPTAAETQINELAAVSGQVEQEPLARGRTGAPAAVRVALTKEAYA
jgi:hypothetical protein